LQHGGRERVGLGERDQRALGAPAHGARDVGQARRARAIREPGGAVIAGARVDFGKTLARRVVPESAADYGDCIKRSTGRSHSRVDTQFLFGDSKK
jgi:hypothetical protein